MRNRRGGRRQGAGRKSSWKNSETQTIRVPVQIKDELLAVCRQLDRGQGVIGGRLQRELEGLLQGWEVQAQQFPESDPEWKTVRQLLTEVRGVLALHTYTGMGHQKQHRQGYGQRSNESLFTHPVSESLTTEHESVGSVLDI